MGSIRDIKRYFEANIEYALKVPLRKAKSVVLGDPVVPTKVGAATAKTSVVPIAFDNRKFMVAYNRKDIQAYLAPLLLPTVRLAIPATAKTTKDLVPIVNKRWGLTLTERDVVDEPLAYTTALGLTTVKLTMSSVNVWFSGTVQLPVWTMQIEDGRLAYAVDWSPLSVTARPTINDTTRKLASGALLTYGVDYSAANAACAAMTQVEDRTTWSNGVPAQQTALAAAMRAIDGLPWVASSSMAPYNLMYSHVIYNGPTEGFKGSLSIAATDGGSCDYVTDSYTRYDRYVNQAMRNVLILQLNHDNGCTNAGGVLFIHYGGASDRVVERPYKAPVHYWPLNGDLKNKVPGGPDLKIPVNWWPVLDGTSRPALVTAGGSPLGVTLPANSDYTLALTLQVGYRASPVYIGLLSDASMTNHKGALLINNASKVYNQDVVPRWVGPHGDAELHYCGQFVLTVVKKGNVYRYYANGVLCTVADWTGAVLPDLTHFGNAGAVFPNNFLFHDFYYYDYAMSADQVLKLARGDYGRGQ